MSPTKKNRPKVKDLAKKPVSARKAEGIKGGQKLQPHPKPGPGQA